MNANVQLYLESLDKYSLFVISRNIQNQKPIKGRLIIIGISWTITTS